METNLTINFIKKKKERKCHTHTQKVVLPEVAGLDIRKWPFGLRVEWNGLTIVLLSFCFKNSTSL